MAQGLLKGPPEDALSGCDQRADAQGCVSSGVPVPQGLSVTSSVLRGAWKCPDLLRESGRAGPVAHSSKERMAPGGQGWCRWGGTRARGLELGRHSA